MDVKTDISTPKGKANGRNLVVSKSVVMPSDGNICELEQDLLLRLTFLGHL